MRKYLWLLALPFMLWGCSQDEEIVTPEPSVPNYRITIEEAQVNALSFANDVMRRTRSSASHPLEVGEAYPVVNKKIATRGVSQAGDDTLYYIINFADNQGFVVASADKRLEDVLAYVEEGSYDDTDTTNVMFTDYMASIKKISEVTKEHGKETFERFRTVDRTEMNGGYGRSGGGFHIADAVAPRLQTTWGQFSPYNQYCPKKRNHNLEHSPTGCVNTAIAQICSFLRYPTRASYAGPQGEVFFDINWDEVMKEVEMNKGSMPDESSATTSIAHLMRFWGYHFKSNYGDVTGTNSADAIKTLRKFGVKSTKLMNYSLLEILKALQAPNNIIYMRAATNRTNYLFFNTYSGGHAWVVDGYCKRKARATESYYLHCNWGWRGINNGYFPSRYLFTDDFHATYDDAKRVERMNLYFKYDRQIAIISK